MTATSADELLLQQLRLLPVQKAVSVLQGLDPAILKAALQPENPWTEDSANRRDTPRNRILRSGKIIYNNQMCVIDCLIRDISLTGCRVRLANPGMIPNHFVLQVVGTSHKHGCIIVWRTAQELGLKFID